MIQRVATLMAAGLMAAAGARAAEPPAVVIAPDAIQPHAAIDGDGNVYVALIHKGNVAVAVSTDRGKTFVNPVVAIDVGGRARGGMQRGPRIGVDAKGVVTVTCPVTFDDDEYKKRYPTAELYLVSSKDGGKTWGKPVQVNEVAKQAPEALHWTAVAPDGTVHVSWLDRRGRTGRGQDLYYARVVAGKVGKNVQVASLVCECCAPGLAVDAAGNPFLAYREGGDKQSREIFALRSTDGGDTFGKPVQVNAKETKEHG